MIFLTPESVNWVETVIERRWRISIGQPKHFVALWELVGNFCILVVGCKLSSFEGPDGVSPSLEGPVHQTTIKPWGDLVQLHTRVVGGVASVEIVAITQKWDEPV